MTSLNRRRKYLPNEEQDEFDEIYRRLNHAHERIEELQRQMAKRQHFQGWWEPLWQNGFAQVSVASGLEPHAYKWASSKFPVFKGHVDVSGASSGNIAYTLESPEGIYLPYSVRDHIILTDDDGATSLHGVILLDKDTLDITIIWPVG